MKKSITINGSLYEIETSINDSWWKVSKDMEFHANVINEEEARRVVWLEANKTLDEPYAYLTDDMFTEIKNDG